MRFDLEIPQNGVDICVISDGANIPNIAAPLYYININNSNKVPADFITSDVIYGQHEYSAGGYEIKNGPYLNDIRSSSFLLTDVSKYSFKNNTKIPLFYRHFIPQLVKEDAISIVDYYGISIDKDLYTVQYENNGTYIYMNKVDGIYFVQYVINNATNKVLLNLDRVFDEASWSDINKTGILPKHKYIYRSSGAIDTSYNGELYITYVNNSRMFRKPQGNMEDPWFVGILNCDLKVGSNTYSIPEYYLQQFNSDNKYRFIEFKKCTKLFNRYVKSQYNIFDKYYDDIYIYVVDEITNKVKYAFSYDKSKIGTLYSDGVYYSELKYYNNEGIIEVPIDLLDTDLVFTSHYTKEDYYNYSLLDLNSIEHNDGGFYAIYIKPNITDGRSIYHAKIGSLEFQGEDINFNSFEDYKNFIEFFNYFHVATVATTFNSGDYDFMDIRDKEEISINNKEIADISVDMIYSDITKGNMNIPSNDSVLVSIDVSRLQDEGKISTDEDDVLDIDSLDYIRTLEKNISRTLNASTKPIYEIERRERIN